MATTSRGSRRRTADPGHSLPAPLTSLVGRARELQGLAETVRTTRLVTLTGPGGVGKTRLAIELARTQAARRPHGTWVVDLVTAGGGPDVARHTARVLGVTAGEAAIEALRRHLADRDLLLVLDNCEHLVRPCAELAVALLTSCPLVTILATSREPLGVNGETVWRLDPLAADDAYRLFVERAAQRRPGFLPTAQTEKTVARLCERLDRLPLAIELAAARLSVMSPSEVLAALETRLGVLAGGERLAPPHHRTARAAVEWSYHLLAPEEQATFRRLAVFAAGFDAEAAAFVADEPSFDVLARLVDKSLVAVTEDPGGRTRYRLLETVREHAHELLAAAGELRDARERHLRHFAARADAAHEQWLRTGAQRLVNDLDPDYDNVRMALEWATNADPCTGVRLIGGARDLFFRFGQADGLRLAQELLDRCDAEDRHRAAAQITAGQLAVMLGDFDTGRRELAAAHELSGRLGEDVLQAWSEFFLGLAETLAGNLEPAREHLEAGRIRHRELGIAIGEARCLSALGLTYVTAGDGARGEPLLEAALELYLAAGDAWGQGAAHTLLGTVAQQTRGDPVKATAHYQAAVDCLRRSSDATLLPVALIGQAGVLARREPGRALQVAAAASAIRDRVGGRLAPFHTSLLERIRAGAGAALGPDAEPAWTQGRHLDPDEAVALAFDARSPRPATPAGLSTRELEVAALVAEGLTNKEIAARLHLSVRTVESHVRHVLAKAGLANRTQLATWMSSRLP